jgi:hypothetical protein
MRQQDQINLKGFAVFLFFIETIKFLLFIFSHNYITSNIKHEPYKLINDL